MLLRQAVAAKGSTLDPNAAVHLKLLFSIGIDQLDGAATLPGSPARSGVCIDPSRAEHFINVHNHRDGWNGEQVIPDCLGVPAAKTVTPALSDDVRVHAVIGGGPAPIARETAGDGRRRILYNDIIREDIGLGVGIRRPEAILEGGRAQGGGTRDPDGPGITSSAVGCRQGVIQRVADLGALGLGEDLDLEALIVEPAIMREGSVGDKPIERLAGVRLAGAWIQQVSCLLYTSPSPRDS